MDRFFSTLPAKKWSGKSPIRLLRKNGCKKKRQYPESLADINNV